MQRTVDQSRRRTKKSCKPRIDDEEEGPRNAEFGGDKGQLVRTKVVNDLIRCGNLKEASQPSLESVEGFLQLWRCLNKWLESEFLHFDLFIFSFRSSV
ncbi:hypothetical protein LOK49_LG02G01467 [Camellia lanceoleosa]|uniref:Uncharacterized protein n=1 Tax=Camellia lanceoleosa TaxID=1840588 RepID=A0ACC0IR97_9ERIC|nr:hypothetical protein LOK49_LG02G01467 [Camellia lanceoleosa]